MTEFAGNGQAREHRSGPVGLPVCAAAALLVVAVAAVEFSRPTRLGSGVSPYGTSAADEAACVRISGSRPVEADQATAADIAKMREFAAGRAGYVVWESRRPSGTPELKYRIWKRNLDGSGLAMLSGQRSRNTYAHLGPRISPDGRFVVYAGRRWNSDEGEAGVETLLGGAYVTGPFDAWVVEVDPATGRPGERRELRALRGLLGTAGADRFFVWKDRRTVYVNIPTQKGIYEVDIVEGTIGVKVVENVDGQFLLSPSGRWLFRAVQGGVAVVGLTETLTAQTPGKARELPGCQGVMTSLDDTLIWMRLPGRASVLDLSGTLGREKAAGRELSLLEATRRVHGPYHYAYFPSLSRDGGVVACGVSRFPPSVTGAKSYHCWLRHSHKGADYEIFLYELDAKTGDVAGAPVRYSFNDHSSYPELVRGPVPEGELRLGHVLDRFPDVWIGRSSGDASDAAAEPGEVGEDVAPLARARAMETVEPGTALRLYDAAAVTFAGRPTGRRAAERAASLRRDRGFRKEVAAWAVFERMRSIEAKMTAALGGAAEASRSRRG